MKLNEMPLSIKYSLKMRMIHKRDLGANFEKKIPVVVSLTSIPSRLRTLDITIRSMMQQSFQPEKIVLWLKEDLKASIPKRLQKLQGDFFEIRYSPYGFSHRKLIHSLTDFPKFPVITCDDDVIYDKDTVKQLYLTHLEHPDVVIGNRCREITYHNDEVLSYSKWSFLKNEATHKELVMPVGAFCVLYPVNSLDSEVQNVDLFMKLAPRADDLWFKAMALRNGVLSIQNHRDIKFPIPILGTQFIALKKENKGQDKNRVQWNNIQKYYDWNKERILKLV